MLVIEDMAESEWIRELMMSFKAPKSASVPSNSVASFLKVSHRRGAPLGSKRQFGRQYKWESFLFAPKVAGSCWIGILSRPHNQTRTCYEEDNQLKLS